MPAYGSGGPSREQTEGALLALREVATQLLELISEQDVRRVIREVLDDLPDSGATLPFRIAESYVQELFAIQEELVRMEDGAHALVAYVDGVIANGRPTGGN